MNPKEIISFTSKKNKVKNKTVDEEDSFEENPDDGVPDNDDSEFPEEIKPWRQKLSGVLMNMDPWEKV